MGHTVYSQRMVCDSILAELRNYGKALREENRLVFEEMLKLPLRHYGTISYANSINAWAMLLLSIGLKQEKRIRRLEALYERMANGRVQEREEPGLVDKDTR